MAEESENQSLREELERLQSHIRELKQTLIDRDSQLTMADEIYLIRRQQFDSLMYELGQRDQILEKLLESWFWRLMLPPNTPDRGWTGVRRILRLKSPAVESSPIDEAPASRRMQYVHRATDSIDVSKLSLRAIAFYHPWIGSNTPVSGNTAVEWIRIMNGSPRYLGHNQPRLPDALGLYDASEPQVLKKQAAMARQYGIAGFCFYHYWEGGRHELGGTLRQFMSDASLDLQFCICWMNGTDGMQPAGSDFLAPMIPAFSDPRYIRIDGKPVVIVASPSRLRQAELPGLYLVGAIEQDAPTPAGFDARIEFPPSQYRLRDISAQFPLTDSNFKGRIYNYQELVDHSLALDDSGMVTFRTVLPGWDEEALRHGSGDSLAGADTTRFAKWFKQSCEKTVKHRPAERLIFINAWNAWFNAAYMEPDRKFGFAYLHAASNVLRTYHNDPEARQLIETINSRFKRSSDAAIVFHCHYEDLIAPVFEQYLSRIENADLFVTVRNDISKMAVETIHRHCPNVFFVSAENRGRDIRPFLLTLRHLRANGYTIACKVHSKKTPHSEVRTGDQWRELLMGSLLGSANSVAKAAAVFDSESDIGLLGPEGSVVDLRVPHVHLRNTYWLDRLLYQMDRGDLVGKYSWEFVAGSMYWFRLSALDGIEDWLLKDDAFELELGQVDGTLHHAVERIVALYAQARGYKTKEVDFDDTETSRKRAILPKEKPPEDDFPELQPHVEFVSESIEKQRELIRTLETQLEKKERDLANETWVLHQLQKSLSWRVTTPLRVAARLAREVRSGLMQKQAPDPGPALPSIDKAPDAVEFGILKELRAIRTASSNVYFQYFLESGATLDFSERESPTVTVIFVLTGHADVALACLRSLREDQQCSLEVIVIDTASTHQSQALLDRLRGVRVIRAAGNARIHDTINEAGKAAHGEFILLLREGVRQLMPAALDAALATMTASENVGVVGGRLIHADGSLQEAGSIIWQDGTSMPYGLGDDPFNGSYGFRRDVDFCSSTFLLTQRRAFQDLGGFDDKCGLGYEDMDFCARIRKGGLRVVYEPNAAVLCEAASSPGQTTTEAADVDQNAFRHRHGSYLAKQLPATPALIWKARSSDRRESILFIEDRVPHRRFGAGLPRAQSILETLAQRHFVTLYPVKAYQETWDTVYTDIPREVEVMMNLGPERMEDFFLQRRGYYSTILVSRPHNMEFLLPILKKNPRWFVGVNIIYDAEAVFTLREIGLRKLAGSPMSESESAAAFRAEMEMAKAVDVVISVSEYERAVFTQNGVHPVHVLGHAIQPDPTPQAFENREGFLFVGSMRARTPNVDSVIWFVEEILPLIRSRLGNNVPVTIAGVCDSDRIWELASSTVRVTGAVDDLREYYNRARVFVAPTRFAAGIPHKIHESAAQGLPAVVTSLLASQLNWTDGGEVSVADDAKTFAERCVRVYQDKNEWQCLRKNALERVQKDCSVETFKTQLLRIVGNGTG